MALRPDRDYNAMDDITRHWNLSETSAQEAGGVASVLVAGSGAGMGGIQSSGVGLQGISLGGLAITNTVSYKADPSGALPVGMLLQEIVVPSEPNRYYENFQRNTALPGEKVTLIRKGWLVTNKIIGTPTAGATAYLASSGNVTATVPTLNGTYPSVGKFETIKDESGYARVFMDI